MKVEHTIRIVFEVDNNVTPKGITTCVMEIISSINSTMSELELNNHSSIRKIEII